MLFQEVMTTPATLLLLAALLQAAPGKPDAEADRLFDRETGWTGADAAYSVDLGKGRILWLYGDTWIDRYSPKPRMVDNTAAIQNGDDVTFHWGEGKTAFFRLPEGEEFLWPGAGVRIGKPLYLFFHRMKRVKGGGAFGFVTKGTTVARIADPDGPPDRWTVEYRPLPWFRGAKSGNLSFGAGTLAVEDTLHVYGADEEWSRGFGGRALVAARVPASDVLDFSQWRFRTAETWSEKPDGIARLCEGVGAEFSVSRLPSGRFALVTTENGLSARIVARFSETPVGPWSAPRLLYTCPEMKWSPDYFCYAGKAHPELARGEELVITYACNGKDFGATRRDRRIYRPRFVRVALDKDR